jgi:hypothetical protein
MGQWMDGYLERLEKSRQECLDADVRLKTLDMCNLKGYTSVYDKIVQT